MSRFQRYVFWINVGAGLIMFTLALVNSPHFFDSSDFVFRPAWETAQFIMIFLLGFFVFPFFNIFVQVFHRRWKRALYSVGIALLPLVFFILTTIADPGMFSA